MLNVRCEKLQYVLYAFEFNGSSVLVGLSRYLWF